MEKVEIYGWTVRVEGGWMAVALAFREKHPERRRQLSRIVEISEEAIVTMAKLTAALATECRRRGKRVMVRPLRNPPNLPS